MQWKAIIHKLLIVSPLGLAAWRLRNHLRGQMIQFAVCFLFAYPLEAYLRSRVSPQQPSNSPCQQEHSSNSPSPSFGAVTWNGLQRGLQWSLTCQRLSTLHSLATARRLWRLSPPGGSDCSAGPDRFWQQPRLKNKLPHRQRRSPMHWHKFMHHALVSSIVSQAAHYKTLKVTQDTLILNFVLFR